MNERGEVVIGLDLGTSKSKALACTLEGTVVSEAAQAYDLIAPRPGYVEQDAEVVLDGAMLVLRQVCTACRNAGHAIRGIGVSSAMHGVLAVDAHGSPLGPFITWMDRRSAAVAQAWQADGTGLALYERTGAPMHPMLPVCKIAWLMQHEAGFARAHRFVSLKELFVYRWSGEWVIDYGIASATGMFDLRDKTWNAQALAAAGVAETRLSRPVSALYAAPQMRGGLAAALGLDTRVALIAGSSDGALANLGVGAVLRGEVALTLGTSGACRSVTDAPLLDPQGRTFCYFLDDASYIIGGPTSSAGAVLNWLFDLVMADVAPAQRFAAALALAQAAPAGAGGLTCLPFLSGERAPYWDAALRGAYAGLDLSHDRGMLIRAACEAIVYALYEVERVRAGLAGESSSIMLSGGLTHAAFFRRLIADIFDRTVLVPDQDEASAFGAAMLAAVATGAIPDVRDVKARVRYPSRQSPDPTQVAAYRAGFERYRNTVAALRPLDHASSRSGN